MCTPSKHCSGLDTCPGTCPPYFVLFKKSTTLANHQRPVDPFAEFQHYISLAMCGGRLRMSIMRIWYRWVCRHCTRGGIMGNEFLGQVSDWLKDAVDPPKVRSVNRWRGLGS